MLMVQSFVNEITQRSIFNQGASLLGAFVGSNVPFCGIWGNQPFVQSVAGSKCIQHGPVDTKVVLRTKFDALFRFLKKISS